LRSGPPNWERAAALHWPRCARRGSSGGIGPAQLDQIEIYHDRVRETVLTHLSPAARRWCHDRLARVLEVSGQADPEVLADHFLGAGDRLRACDFYDQAADKAEGALAFDHAARLYRLALELDCRPPAAQRRLGKKLGDALSNGGRGAEAALVYLQAAVGATAAETLELKRQASTQLLISGHVDEGLTLLRTILGPLGLSMPSTPQGALLSLIRHRAMLRLRGLRFRSRDETQVSAEDLTRIDLCWSAVAGLSVIDPILGADFPQSSQSPKPADIRRRYAGGSAIKPAALLVMSSCTFSKAAASR